MAEAIIPTPKGYVSPETRWIISRMRESNPLLTALKPKRLRWIVKP